MLGQHSLRCDLWREATTCSDDVVVSIRKTPRYGRFAREAALMNRQEEARAKYHVEFFRQFISSWFHVWLWTSVASVSTQSAGGTGRLKVGVFDENSSSSDTTTFQQVL